MPDKINQVLEHGATLTFCRPPKGGQSWTGTLTLANGRVLTYSATGPDAVTAILEWAAQQTADPAWGEQRLW